jgi:hypothetical protein
MLVASAFHLKGMRMSANMESFAANPLLSQCRRELELAGGTFLWEALCQLFRSAPDEEPAWSIMYNMLRNALEWRDESEDEFRDDPIIYYLAHINDPDATRRLQAFEMLCLISEDTVGHVARYRSLERFVELLDDPTNRDAVEYIVRIIVAIYKDAPRGPEFVVALLRKISRDMQEEMRTEIFRAAYFITELRLEGGAVGYGSTLIGNVACFLTTREFVDLELMALQMITLLCSRDPASIGILMKTIGVRCLRDLLGRQPLIAERALHQFYMLGIVHKAFEADRLSPSDTKELVTRLIEDLPLAPAKLMDIYCACLPAVIADGNHVSETDLFMLRITGFIADPALHVSVFGVLGSWVANPVACITNIARVNAFGMLASSAYRNSYSPALAGVFDDVRAAYRAIDCDPVRIGYTPHDFYYTLTRRVRHVGLLPNWVWGCIEIPMCLERATVTSSRIQRGVNRGTIRVHFGNDQVVTVTGDHPLWFLGQLLNISNGPRNDTSRHQLCPFLAGDGPPSPTILQAYPEGSPLSVPFTYRYMNRNPPASPIPPWMTFAEVWRGRIPEDITVRIVMSVAHGEDHHEVLLDTGVPRELNQAGLITDRKMKFVRLIEGDPPVAYLSTMVRPWFLAARAALCYVDDIVRFVTRCPAAFDLGVRLMAFAHSACASAARDRICDTISELGEDNAPVADVAPSLTLTLTCTPETEHEVGRIVLETISSGLFSIALVTRDTAGSTQDVTETFFQRAAHVIQTRLMTVCIRGLIPRPDCTPRDFGVIGNLLGRVISQQIPLGEASWTAFFEYINVLDSEHPNYVAFTTAFGSIFPRAGMGAYGLIRAMFTPGEMTTILSLEGIPWYIDADVLADRPGQG